MKRSLFMLALAASVLAGCGTAHIQTPAGFAAHDAGDNYDYRASDGEGVVLAVRREHNRMRGDLQFWTSALDAQLRRSGYEARAQRDVTSADGQAGKQIRYSVQHEGRELAFWVTLFVTQKRVVIVEAGGDMEFFSAKTEVVEHAIASVEVG